MKIVLDKKDRLWYNSLINVENSRDFCYFKENLKANH